MTTNVKDFGDVGGGVNDDSDAILAAIAATPVGGILEFPAPSVAYKTTKAINVNKRIALEGGMAKIKLTGDGFKLNDKDAAMRGFVIEGTRLSTGQCAIELTQSNVRVEDIYISDTSHGVRASGGTWHNISKIRGRNIVTGVLEAGNVVGTVVEDFRYDTDAGCSEPQFGTYVWGEGCNFADMDFIHAGTALMIKSTMRSVFWTFFNSCSFDTSNIGCYIEGNALNQKVAGLMFDQCWFASHGTAGIYINASNKVDGVTFSDCHVVNNKQHGVIMVGKADNIDFNGVVFSGNGVSQPGTYHNIYSNIEGKKFIRNCNFGTWGGFATTAKYDILRAEQDGICVIDGNVAYNGSLNGYISGSSVPATFGRNFGNLPSA